MASWILRFKVGSTKNKPLVVGDDDPELARVARIAQIIYELFCTLVNSKGNFDSINLSRHETLHSNNY